jgi:hypothetical protein
VRPREVHHFVFPLPLLWVYARDAVVDTGAMLRVRTRPGGRWATTRRNRGVDFARS